MSDKAENTRLLMNILGLARRAGKLLLGQDEVLSASRGGALLVFVADDCASNVLRSLRPAEERGRAEVILLKDTDRAALGSSLGVKTAQIAALPREDGFAEKALSIYYRSGANEQNQSI